MITPQLTVTSGTPQRLSSTDLWVESFIVISKLNNSGVISIGTTSAIALYASGEGIELSPGDKFSIYPEYHRTIAGYRNLKEWWFDGAVEDDAIMVIYVQ